MRQISMKKINSHVINTKEQIDNTLLTLFNSGLTRMTRQVAQTIRGDETILTWNNHMPSRYNCGKSFTAIMQYISIYESGAYHAILHDGSIIRVFFKFKKNILTHQSLLYWPSPITIAEEYIDELGIRDAIELYIANKCENSLIEMRSPFRLDFDSSNATEEHPETHLHMQHADCRISVKKPICFNTFIKFIFKNFYPHIYKQHQNTIQKLSTLTYSGYTENSKYTINI